MNKKAFILRTFLHILMVCFMFWKTFFISSYAMNDPFGSYSSHGGGYAITGQIPNVSYYTEIYDASSGLPTSDAMFLMGSQKGYIWIGGYSGVICYDGSVFERIEGVEGLTSARAIFEDSKGRVWVGTNDNGVVLIDGKETVHITYKDGLPSSSIRIFAEDNKGNIFVGSTAGVCYIDQTLNVNVIEDNRISEERVLKLEKDISGTIYGQTSNGVIFSIEDCKVGTVYRSAEVGMEKITSILCDPYKDGMLYFGTDESIIYYGKFGNNAEDMKVIPVDPLEGIHWLNYDCGRVWVSSTSMAGYLDGDKNFSLLENLPIDSGIEMMTSDYQGNIWLASSTQGVMKIVTNNFIDISNEKGLPKEVVNSTCIYQNNLYIGTDAGLQIVGKNGDIVENDLTKYLGEARVRCLKADNDGNLWVATFTHNLGLICYDKTGKVSSFNTKNGMINDQIRCIEIAHDGSVLVGSNGGLTIIKDGEISKTFGAKDGIKNTVFLTIEEIKENVIIAGTDGDGIYIIENDNIKKYDRDDGLTSDVILKIIKDDSRQVYWIITSNSIEYLKGNTITCVESFPYNNNYDMCFDSNGNAWLLTSYGLYMVNADEMYNDAIKDYRLYTINNGLPYAITSNSFSYKNFNGDLYIPGRYGVIKVNINNFYDENEEVLMDIKSIYCDKEQVFPDEKGVYHIPAQNGHIQITASVMDYTMLNPTVRVFLDGAPDYGVLYHRSSIAPLVYTSLSYGNYVLHIQVLNNATKEVLQDKVYEIKKAPRLFELLLVRVLFLIFVALFVGFMVWWIMRYTVINKQYDAIRQAKEEAENANAAKSRFLANISHEIRTPINTIMGMNEMVMREDATNVPKGYFMSMMNYAFDIRNASESLLGLINDLLDMSKIESGKMHLVEQEYDTQEMLRSIASMIRVRSMQKGLSFDVVIDEILPQKLYGDAGKIKQIVLNLLTNAVKYTKVGGFCLSVSMEERKDKEASLRFSVKDTGMGVKEEDMDKLFSAYERLDEVKNSAIQGTGLGLDISRKFAQLMNGNLWCESVYGEGSEFILTLNQKIVDETPIGIFVEHDESKTNGPYVPKFVAPDVDILVVDDNPMNLNVIKGLLKATKVFVTTSESGEDAIDKIRDNHFDVVLLDHMMPGIDGIETLEIIREFHPDLPVYALTANSVAGEDFYKSKGFNGYLSKPIDIETLEKTLMKHIPENKKEKPAQEDSVAELTELPENMLWLNSAKGLSVPDGIKNSGGISGFLFALKLFYDTIDENNKVLRDALDQDNIRLFTIKVHALKSSARIIGAKELSKLAEDLENAGNKEDIVFIQKNTDTLLTQYLEYKEILAGIKEKESSDSDKEAISEEKLKDAYDALEELVPQMDYDSVEMILNDVAEYSLPDEDKKVFDELSKMLHNFDWDAMEELVLHKESKE